MNTWNMSSAIVSLGVVLATAAGCSPNPSSGEPNFDEVDREFDQPSGTLTKQNVGDALSAVEPDGNLFGSELVSSEETVSTRSAGGLGLRSLNLLDSNDSRLTCPGLKQGNETGSCACPAGGHMQYDFTGLRAVASDETKGAFDLVLSVKYDACAQGDTTVNGALYIRLKAGARTAGAPPPDATQWFLIDATVTRAGQTKRLGLASRFRKNEIVLAVRVDDGWVAARAAQSGKTQTIVIRDRNTTWTCARTSGNAVCTSTSGELRPS